MLISSLSMQKNTTGKSYFLFIIYFLFLWGGQLSSALASKGESSLNLFLIPLYFCFFSRAVIWFFILRKMELIKAYTLSSLNYLIVPFLSFFVLEEPLLMKHLLGGVCIAGGIILFSAGEQKKISLRAGSAIL